MNILLLSNELPPEHAGGIATYIATIAPALAERGHTVHVLSCADEHDDGDQFNEGVWWHRRSIRRDRVKRISDHYPQTILRVRMALAYRRELRRLAVTFDVVESPEWLAQGLMIEFGTHIPVVVNLHTPLKVLFSFDVWRFGVDLRWANRLEKETARRARAVTSTSKLLGDLLTREGWLRQSPMLIPYPVRPTPWGSMRPVAESAPTILVVGRLEARKAPEIAVEAASLLAAEVPDLRLVFVGRSRGYRIGGQPYGEWVAELADRRGVRATFAPQIPNPELGRLYEAARVVAVPSRFESFSIAALEGMACGRPVVCTSQVGASEVIAGNQVGAIVRPDDPKALADGLRRFLVEPHHAQRVGTAASEVVRARCAPDTIAALRERCFESAVRGEQREEIWAPPP